MSQYKLMVRLEYEYTEVANNNDRFRIDTKCYHRWESYIYEFSTRKHYDRCKDCLRLKDLDGQQWFLSDGKKECSRELVELPEKK